MSAIGEAARSGLFALADEKYKDFTSTLVPTVEAERVIGVRSPALRQLAKELLRRPDALDYLEELPHFYLEENLLHCRFLESLKDYPRLLAELERFLPHVDNWAVSDSLNPKLLRRHLPELLPVLRGWLGSPHCYTVRFALLTLMRCCLDEGSFRPEYLDWAAELEREEYYIRMMQAWYFAEALARQYETTLPVLTEHRLDLWVHNKAIQKAVESRKISPERKEHLKSLRRKGSGKAEK